MHITGIEFVNRVSYQRVRNLVANKRNLESRIFQYSRKNHFASKSILFFYSLDTFKIVKVVQIQRKDDSDSISLFLQW